MGSDRMRCMTSLTVIETRGTDDIPEVPLFGLGCRRKDVSGHGLYSEKKTFHTVNKKQCLGKPAS